MSLDIGNTPCHPQPIKMKIELSNTSGSSLMPLSIQPPTPHPRQPLSMFLVPYISFACSTTSYQWHNSDVLFCSWFLLLSIKFSEIYKTVLTFKEKYCLDQWFSNCNRCKIHLNSLLKHIPRLWYTKLGVGPSPWAFLIKSRWCPCCCQRTTLWEPLV